MIEVKNLVKRYGKFTALQDVSLQMNKGQTIALIGPNGSGKTTLIKCILGLAVPSEGNILFNGKSVLNQWEYRSAIGYMPQISSFPENMKVGQLLQMMKEMRNGNHQQYDEELVDVFSVKDIFGKTMRSLSGGTRQKVSACIAFMFNPDVLILDEPTAGLDPLSSEKLKEKITKEKAKGKLILITSHVLSDLDDITSEVIYMQEGRLQFHSTVQELQQHTGEERLNKMIASLMMRNGGANS